MGVLIQLDQAAHSAGVPGRARQDFALGTAVTATAIGGPFGAYRWTLAYLPVDTVAGTRASSLLSASDAPATLISPIDVKGTYRVALAVDSGNGLGAGPEDNAVITFYAGPGLDVTGWGFPRRTPAVGETIEHNALDAIDPVTGNPDGWGREKMSWDAAGERIGEALEIGQLPSLAIGSPKLIRGDVRYRVPLIHIKVSTTGTSPGTEFSVVPFNPALYYPGDAHLTRTITLNIVASTPNLNGYTFDLYNLTDAGSAQTISGSHTTAFHHSAVMGGLPNSEKLYSCRIMLVNNGDPVVAVALYSAYIEIAYT